MSGPQAGDTAPDFEAPTDGGGSLKLSSLQGKNVILYFYPKDDTPGCTKEACGFRDTMEDLAKSGTVVVGVSKDSVKQHDNFKAKYDLNFNLVADEDGSICEAYGVWVEKKNYGRTYMGLERSTFLIDAKGTISEVWRKVRVNGHVVAVNEAAAALP
ncbi:MAG: thioredoxin-dependent thiol peroxidase [Rhodospirillaceae bacterium]|nr:thioredoxin-dependent thiol peroxidase [Rhodospirillaceae bacterium]|tara:strand:- start:3442 stop:3912 length:471 start_codon:yes stop_codon:yes gene_type:complete